MDDDDDFEEAGEIMYADTIAVTACRGHCAAHILFLDTDGTVFSEASLSSEMALELAQVLVRLGNGELPAAIPQRLHA
jgi:hypothetical protein